MYANSIAIIRPQKEKQKLMQRKSVPLFYFLVPNNILTMVKISKEAMGSETFNFINLEHNLA